MPEDRPDEMLRIFNSARCEAYMVKGRVRVFIDWTISKVEKKTGDRIETKHSEVMWFDEWNPEKKSFLAMKAKVSAAIESWNYLAPVHAK
jgi:hypothetical protein